MRHECRVVDLAGLAVARLEEELAHPEHSVAGTLPEPGSA